MDTPSDLKTQEELRQSFMDAVFEKTDSILGSDKEEPKSPSSNIIRHYSAVANAHASLLTGFSPEDAIKITSLALAVCYDLARRVEKLEEQNKKLYLALTGGNQNDQD